MILKISINFIPSRCIGLINVFSIFMLTSYYFSFFKSSLISIKKSKEDLIAFQPNIIKKIYSSLYYLKGQFLKKVVGISFYVEIISACIHKIYLNFIPTLRYVKKVSIFIFIFKKNSKFSFKLI